MSTPEGKSAAAEAPTQSIALFDRARQVIPGGVNSPVRAFRAVGGTPLFISSGVGPASARCGRPAAISIS